MDFRVLINNIDRFNAEGLSDDALSNKAGTGDAIRNLRRIGRGEKSGSWKLDTLEKVAKALGVASWELLKPPSGIALDENSRDLVRALIREELDSSAPKQKTKRSR